MIAAVSFLLVKLASALNTQCVIMGIKKHKLAVVSTLSGNHDKTDKTSFGIRSDIHNCISLKTRAS